MARMRSSLRSADTTKRSILPSQRHRRRSIPVIIDTVIRLVVDCALDALHGQSDTCLCAGGGMASSLHSFLKKTPEWVEILAEHLPQVESLVTEDDTPVDHLLSAKQQRLLVESLYTSWGKSSKAGQFGVGPVR